VLKILQITDCHLLPPGETVFGSDPRARLAAAIDDINRHHSDAALCVLTGDLAHHADERAYVALREVLADLPMPYQLLPGNHDDRTGLRTVFPEVTVDDDGFIQSMRDTPAGRFIFLDTVDPGVHTGAYCERRCAWLAAALDNSRDRPIYFFLHHPPFPIALPHIDQYRMLDSAAFAAVIAGHSNIRHMFLGHVHRPVSGSWHGIPFSALRGTNHQNWLDFAETRRNISSLEPPAYAIVFLDADTTVVHFHDYLDASQKFLYDPDAPRESQVQPLQ
jgi:3',5'-cyclic AMP phosphodiesterase CpdA